MSPLPPRVSSIRSVFPLGRLYENRALPSTYFVDAEGVIQEVVIGGPMAEALLRTRTETLLKGGR